MQLVWTDGHNLQLPADKKEVMDPTALVRESTARVVQQSKYVRIDSDAAARLAVKLGKCVILVSIASLNAHSIGLYVQMQGDRLENDEQGFVTWDSGDFHYFADVAQDGHLTCQYVFVMDALNFCFWPTENMEYEHLARGLKNALLKDPHALDAENLARVTSETLTSWFHPFTPPQLEERKRKVKELGEVLLHFFDGKALNLITQAKCSAVEAIRLILAYFPGFRDHALYKGEQVHFYKRAQILVGDVWAAYGRRSTGVASFHDIGKLTMFADYRVPQVLRPEGVMVYTEELAQLVDSKTEIPSGSEMELEIRAATIQAVEMIHRQMEARDHKLKVIELDWFLWQIGEDNKDSLQPHHRTLSIYY